MGIEVFNNEERILLNSICKNEKLEKLTLKNVEETLLWNKEVVDENDTMIKDLVDGLYSKVKDMTEEQWNKIKMLVPFTVVEATEDEITEDELSA